jgi:hypothetical protein
MTDGLGERGSSDPGAFSAAPGQTRGASPLLLAALLATLVLWNVPYGWCVLYPFKVFATWLHEMSHGLAMILTGAGFRKMEIFRDTSGLAFPGGGVSRAAQAVVSSAGYMGTAFFGAVFLVLGRTTRGARTILLVLGGVMALSAALWVRNGFGIVATAAGGVTLAVVGWKAGEAVSGFIVNFLAAQSCINAVLDIRVLFGQTMYVNGQPHGQSDAHTVARMIGAPYWVWAATWLVWSFALFYLALRRVRPVPDPEPIAPVPSPAPSPADGS